MTKNGAKTGNNSIVPHFDDESDENLKIRLQEIRDIPHCVLFYLTGYIDITNSNYFQGHVAMAIRAGFIKLIFNTRGTFMLSSVEITCYSSFLRAVIPRGGDLIIIEMPPKVYEAYCLLGFASIFTIRESLDDAINHLATAGDIFPMTFKCPICVKLLKATKAGQLLCPECRTMLVIDMSGHMKLD
jgi:anti-sigma B factor antagonist